MAPQGLAPLSYASIVVGFISFAFTFFTFVRVFWETILTLWSAPTELERVLDNLRFELHEERAYLKSMIRRSKSRSRGRKLHTELGPLRLLNDSVRDLMTEFKKLEDPFLSEPADIKEKDVERSEVSFWSYILYRSFKDVFTRECTALLFSKHLRRSGSLLRLGICRRLCVGTMHL